MIAPGTLFGRAWEVVVGTLDVSNLDMGFQVKRTLKPEPNTAELKLYNLNPAHRKVLEMAASSSLVQKGVVPLPVSISAGYKTGPLAQIFLGNMRATFSTTNGPDIVTELSSGDGEANMASARMNTAFGPGSPISIVLQEIIGTLGVGPGNLAQALATLSATGKVTWSAKGCVLKGNAADHLSDACRSLGLEWSVQNGAVQILVLGQPLAGRAVLVTPNTGLVGSPSVDSKGVLQFTTLLIPGIKPGVLVLLQSNAVQGQFRVVSVESTGDTLGEEWYHRCSAEKF